MTAREVGEVHKHVLPNANDVPHYKVYQCECGDKFYCAPTGIFSNSWQMAGELKIEGSEQV